MARQNLIYEDLFERADPKDKYTAQQQWCCSYSVTSATDIVREGTRSVRMEHRPNDYLSGGYRVEFQSSTLFKNPTEAWYGYSLYFKDWKTFSGGEHIPQWHPTVSGGSASLGIYTQDGTFHVRLNPEGDSTAFTLKDGKSIVSNKWYDFVWHVKWGSGSNGRVELWIDGEKYVDYTGSTLTNGGVPYFKFGINRWGFGGAPSIGRIFYADALRIGSNLATYADVAPGESTTPPPPNQPPTVNAGGDITITLPSNSVTLSGIASDPDGSVVSYLWTKVSGIGGDILSPTSPVTLVTGLTEGTYIFRLTASDNKGVLASDDVSVVVYKEVVTPVKTIGSVVIRYTDGSSEEIKNYNI